MIIIAQFMYEGTYTHSVQNFRSIEFFLKESSWMYECKASIELESIQIIYVI